MLNEDQMHELYKKVFGDDRTHDRHMAIALAIKLLHTAVNSTHKTLRPGDFGAESNGWEWRKINAWIGLGVLALEKPFRSTILTNPPEDALSIRFAPEFLKLIQHEEWSAVTGNLPLPSMAYQAQEKKDPLRADEWEEHPAFGVVTVMQPQGYGFLFGSNFKHRQCIEVTVHSAKRQWVNNSYHTFPDRPRFTFRLSEAQWGAMLSSMAKGEGTPVTITFDENGRVPECPYSPKMKAYKKEMERKAKDAAATLTAALSKLKDLVAPGKTVSKKDLAAIVKEVEHAEMAIADGLPFLQTCYAEAMEVVVNDAKAEIEAAAANLRALSGPGVARIDTGVILELPEAEEVKK